MVRVFFTSRVMLIGNNPIGTTSEFEGEAVASAGVAHPPRVRRWPGAAAFALKFDSSYSNGLSLIREYKDGAARPPRYRDHDCPSTTVGARRSMRAWNPFRPLNPM